MIKLRHFGGEIRCDAVRLNVAKLHLGGIAMKEKSTVELNNVVDHDN